MTGKRYRRRLHPGLPLPVLPGGHPEVVQVPAAGADGAGRGHPLLRAGGRRRHPRAGLRGGLDRRRGRRERLRRGRGQDEVRRAPLLLLPRGGGGGGGGRGEEEVGPDGLPPEQGRLEVLPRLGQVRQRQGGHPGVREEDRRAADEAGGGGLRVPPLLLPHQEREEAVPAGG